MLTKARSISLQWLLIFSSIFALSPASAQDAGLDTEQLSACAYPNLPAIVDGSNTSKEAMSRMGKQVREFVVAVEASLVCLDNAAKKATPENAKVINQLYNNGVDQLNFIAKQYNEQAQRYNRYRQIQENALILQDPLSYRDH
ncbi:MAG: hypothetical protein V7459_01375 [Oceanicoccus sp.]